LGAQTGGGTIEKGSQQATVLEAKDGQLVTEAEV